MNVIDKIHMLKKMVKEAERFVTWQQNIYTALHNIHADWIVIGTIAWGRLVANFPRTIAELLSDHDKAAHDALDIDADTVDGAHKTDLEGTMDGKITTHAGVAAAHHAVHLKTLGDHPLSIIPTMDDAHIPAAIARDTEVDSKIATHKGDASAHHAKYTNAEARATVKANVEVGDLKTPTKNLGMNLKNITDVYGIHGDTGPAGDLDFYVAAGQRLRLESSFAIFFTGIIPITDNGKTNGLSSKRWSDIWAVNTHFGDLGFAEKTCPKCEGLFEVGDEIILKVVRLDESDSGIMTIPMHLDCAHKSPKTIKRNIPQFTTECAFVEGKVVEVRVPLRQKRVIAGGGIRDRYSFDKFTGTFFKKAVMKEGYNRIRAGDFIKKGEPRDGYRYNPDMKKYFNLQTNESVDEEEACKIVPEKEAVIPKRPAPMEEATEDIEVEEIVYKEVEVTI